MKVLRQRKANQLPFSSTLSKGDVWLTKTGTGSLPKDCISLYSLTFILPADWGVHIPRGLKTDFNCSSLHPFADHAVIPLSFTCLALFFLFATLTDLINKIIHCFLKSLFSLNSGSSSTLQKKVPATFTSKDLNI